MVPALWSVDVRLKVTTDVEGASLGPHHIRRIIVQAPVAGLTPGLHLRWGWHRTCRIATTETHGRDRDSGALQVPDSASCQRGV